MQVHISQNRLEKIRARLELLYPGEAANAQERLLMTLGRYGVGIHVEPAQELWSEKDAVLITYADMISSDQECPLDALTRFGSQHLSGAIKTVHLLPFCPYSSDDGFSVIDYRQVKPETGDWKNVANLRNHFELMFDLVLNHCSRKSDWFRQFVKGVLPGKKYFIEADPATDLSKVVRPRTSPLLTKTTTRLNETHVWTTFSADQVDLNWANPDVFFEMLDILLFYISQGARIVRLDAVAFLWKTIGTDCLHLPETHEVVKLFRDILDVVAPKVLLLTETNVPHAENISYFGDGDEAHMVYNFSLPPLLLHTLLTGDSGHLTAWAKSLPELPDNCTFFNFTASHDGIGVRPLQGILSEVELAEIVREVEMRGGRVNWRTLSEGSKSPYELNITYFSALSDVGHPENQTSMDRFVCSQLIALAFKGVPGIYFHSLLATLNYLSGVEETGQNRTINRRKWKDTELQRILADPDSHQPKVFFRYLDALKRRNRESAFHPNAAQEILDLGSKIFALKRTSQQNNETITCLFNITSETVELDIASLFSKGDNSPTDILTDNSIDSGNGKIALAPYQVLWAKSF